VIVDPLSAYLGKADSYKDAEVRGVLAPLAELAERHHVAVVAILHLSKDAQRRALYRAQGSIAFVAAARAVFAVAADPDQPTRRLLTPIKMNIAPLPPTLAFRITEDQRLEWAPEPVEIDAETALAGSSVSDERDERQSADAFLQELLIAGEMPAVEVLKATRANGIAPRTLDRAKRRLGIAVRHEGQPGKSGAWFWSLPKAATGSPKSATVPEVASFGQAVEKTADSARTSPKNATFQGVAFFEDGSGGLRTELEELDL
jgi:hypothetical protein